MHRLTILVLGLAAGIASSSLGACSDEPGDLCGRLAIEPSCEDGDAKSVCEMSIAMAKSATPECAPLVDALVECIADLELSCTGPASIAANGDGMVGGGQNFVDVGGSSVVVNDSECDEHRRGLAACQSCPDAAGATTVGVLGVGDRCGPEDTCAAGLQCDGICTRSCTEDAQCSARADGCALQFQYPNVCSADGFCTRSCGGDYECETWVGPGSLCVDSECTL